MEDKDIIGWYTPHEPVNWTGEVYDKKLKRMVKEESKTMQSFRDECDINNVVKSFRTVQDVLDLTAKNAQGVFTDLPDPISYQEALNAVIAGEQAFSALSSTLRNRFENDPAQFLAFMEDPSNQDEMVKLGLATLRPVAQTTDQADAPPSPPDGTPAA